MELHKIGIILFDIGIGIGFFGAVIRLILLLVFYKRNGSRTLSEIQINTMKKVVIPIVIIGLLLSIISMILCVS